MDKNHNDGQHDGIAVLITVHKTYPHTILRIFVRNYKRQKSNRNFA